MRALFGAGCVKKPRHSFGYAYVFCLASTKNDDAKLVHFINPSFLNSQLAVILITFQKYKAMENISFLLILRFSLTLLVAFWIVSKFRHLLRAIIVRLMPPKHRFSENAFNIQTRISAVLSIILVIGIAAALDYGIFKARVALNLFPSKQPNVIKYSVSPDISDQVPEVEIETAPEDKEKVKEKPPEAPKPEPAEKTTPAKPQFYAQVEAFVNEENAWNEKMAVQPKVDRAVLVAVIRNDPIPYKVLIGPFDSRKAAASYLRQHRLQGFPRSASGLLFPAQ